MTKHQMFAGFHHARAYMGKTDTPYYVLGALLLLSTAGWFGYKWHVTRTEEAAHRELAYSIEEYKKLEQSNAQPTAWHDLSVALDMTAQKHRSSVLAPYFYVYQSDALLHENKPVEALAALDKALSIFNTKDELYPFYQLKRALLKVDSTNEVVKLSGMTELDALARDKNSSVYQEAQYYKGLFSWLAGKQDEALSVWNPLLDELPEDAPLRQRIIQFVSK